MKILKGLKPEKVFYYFEELTQIPHGSGNMEKISEWCVDFARSHSLRCVKDSACNVIIYKDGTAGREELSPIILQGHLDMVCQKNDGVCFDFESMPLDIYVDDGFIKARGTTLGADNGIGAAMILALLASNDIPHPPIEAVFTTDEEIGMVGAAALDMSALKSCRMINLDSEDLSLVTVSCAGGIDLDCTLPLTRTKKEGRVIKILLDGFQGGHSGVEIGNNRINAAILLGRILNRFRLTFPFELISITGGDRTNVITKTASAVISVNDESLTEDIESCLAAIKEELSACEPDFFYTVEKGNFGEQTVIEEKIKNDIIFSLSLSPQGVAAYSGEISGLVESSQNLGVLSCGEDTLHLGYSLRSSKTSALEWLEDRMRALLLPIGAKISTRGAYPPWEFCKNSRLQKIYNKCFEEEMGFSPKTVAIHAGLECGIFSSKLNSFDCISIGPELYDIHTPNERVNISSVEKLWQILLKVLENLD